MRSFVNASAIRREFYRSVGAIFWLVCLLDKGATLRVPSQLAIKWHREATRLGSTSASYDVRRLRPIVGELIERAITGNASRNVLSGPNVKTSLLEAIATNGRTPLSAPNADVIERLCRQLEKLGTRKASRIDGSWRISYSTAPWPSNGKLGPVECEARHVVDEALTSYRNSLRLGALEVILAGSMKQEESLLLASTTNITLRLGPLSTSFDAPKQLDWSWRTTYVDETIRVVRASVRDPIFARDQQDNEFLYLLTRDLGPRQNIKANLLKAVQDDQAAIPYLADILASTAPPRYSDFQDLLVGSYKVIWTTEAELNALLRNPKSCAYQTVTLDACLRNLVDFGDGSFLAVSSSCKPTPPTRVYFEFQSCKAELFGFQIDLPPVGSGHFDVLYLDRDLRVTKDSRGDLQLATRKPLSSPHRTVASPPTG